MSQGNFSADSAFTPSLPVDPHRATPWTLFARGDFGGGTITVTTSPDGDTPFALATPITISAAGYKVLPLIGGVFTLTLAGATAPDIDWWLL